MVLAVIGLGRMAAIYRMQSSPGPLSPWRRAAMESQENEYPDWRIQSA